MDIAKRKTLSRLQSIIAVAAVLWLAVACGDDAPKDTILCFEVEEQVTVRGTVYTDKYIECLCLEDEEQKAATATKEKSMDTSQTGYMSSSEAVQKARAIRHKYDAMFWRHPNVHAVGIGNTRDENGEKTGKWGFVIHVTKKVDQRTLPPEDRIPGCLEGVLTEIREDQPPVLQ